MIGYTNKQRLYKVYILRSRQPRVSARTLFVSMKFNFYRTKLRIIKCSIRLIRRNLSHFPKWNRGGGEGARTN